MPDPGVKNHPHRPTWALIPAHNEEAAIAAVVHAALPHVGAVYVVADGCTDGTARAAAAAGARVLVNGERRGKAAALRHAWTVLAAEAEWTQLILLDGDGQHDPASIPAMIAAQAAHDAEMILGSRRFPPMPLVRRWTNRAMSRVLSRRVGRAVTDTQCGFRLVTRPFVESRRWRSSHFEIESEMILHAADRGWRVAEVPVATLYREERSKIAPLRDGWRWFRFLRRSSPSAPGAGIAF